jgi:hypothetical protein
MLARIFSRFGFMTLVRSARVAQQISALPAADPRRKALEKLSKLPISRQRDERSGDFET